MDLYCQKCGEPWDLIYVLHEMDEDGDIGDAERFQNGEGCPVCAWGRKSPKHPPHIARVATVLRDLLGDDVDCIAAEMDDIASEMDDIIAEMDDPI